MILHLKMRSDIGTGTVNEFTVGTQGRAKAGLGRFAERDLRYTPALPSRFAVLWTNTVL